MKTDADDEIGIRIANISLLCACVVALSHVGWNSVHGSAGWWFTRMTRFGVCCMAVPFFFAVSGYFLSAHFDEPGWWRREIVKRVRTLAVPYLFWSLAFYLFAWLGYAVSHAGDTGLYLALKNPVASIARVVGLSLDEPPFLVPFWYIRALFVLVVLSPLVAIATRRKAVAWTVCAILFAIYVYASPHRNGLRSTRAEHLMYYGFSLFGAFYFCLGATLRRSGVPLTRRLVGRIAGLCIFCIGVGLVVLRTWSISQKRGDPFLILCFAIPMLIAGVWMAMPPVRLPRCLASLAFPIYAMHFFVVYAMDGFVRVHANKSIGLMLAETFAAIAVPILVALAFRRYLPAFSTVVFGGRNQTSMQSGDALKSFLRKIAHCILAARWWILLSVVLCAIDAFIRMQVLWPSVPLAVRSWVFYSLLAIIPVFLLGRAARYVAPVFFPCWVLLECIQGWTAVNFHMTLSGNWILMLFSTSGKELEEFLGGILSVANVALIVVVLSGTAALFAFLASRRRPVPELSVVSVVMALFMVAVSCKVGLKLFNSPITLQRISTRSSMLNLPIDTFANWKAYRALAAACTKVPKYDLSIPSKPPICVFVIGESTTRSHMGLYGYSRNTTPRLDSLKGEGGLAVFESLTTKHSTTPEALCSFLSDGELECSEDIHDVLPSLMKKAGYTTVLISCQGHWQAKDIVGTYLFNACDTKKFLQNDKTPGTLPDEVALPEVQTALKERKGPTAIFIHLYGCHHPAAKRVPPGFKREWADRPDLTEKERRKIDTYDTAVAYADHVVASIIDMVDSLGEPSFVLFLSDHGESPDSSLWRDVKSKDVYEIPFCIWLSREYRAAFPETSARIAAATALPLRQCDLLEGMLEIARIEGYSAVHCVGSFLSGGRETPTSKYGGENAKRQNEE